MRKGYRIQRALPPRDPKADHKRCNGVKISHMMSRVRAEHPLFKVIQEGEVLLSHDWQEVTYTRLQWQTQSPLPVTCRLRALLSSWIVSSTRITSTHAFTAPSTRALAPDKTDLGSPQCSLASEAGKEPTSPAPSFLPITPPSSHRAGNLG